MLCESCSTLGCSVQQATNRVLIAHSNTATAWPLEAVLVHWMIGNVQHDRNCIKKHQKRLASERGNSDAAHRCRAHYHVPVEASLSRLAGKDTCKACCPAGLAEHASDMHMNCESAGTQTSVSNACSWETRKKSTFDV